MSNGQCLIKNCISKSEKSFKLFSKIFLYFSNKFFFYNFINIKWHTDGKYRTIILWVRKLNPMCKLGILEAQLLIQLPQQNLPNVVLVVVTRCWAHSPPVSKSDLRWPPFENQLINKVSVAWKTGLYRLSTPWSHSKPGTTSRKDHFSKSYRRHTTGTT